MKAITFSRYGPPDVLEVSDIAKPVAERGEVLVRVRAACVNRYDWHLLGGVPYIGRLRTGLLGPKVRRLGSDLAGVVEQVGAEVEGVGVGDEVFGQVNGEVPGQPLLELGSFAEYVAVSAETVVPKPSNLTLEQAAAAPMAGRTALQALQDAGRLQPGQRVLINGASGGVGTFAVQIAKAFGAEVTAVCSAGSADLVRSLGADHVIDYASTDFTAGSERYDLIFDLAGSQSVGRCRKILTPTGIYVASTSELRVLLRAGLTSMVARGQVAVFAAKESQADLEALRELIERGAVTPVIDGRYTLAQTPDAFREQAAGHARGRKVVTVVTANSAAPAEAVQTAASTT